MRNTERRYCCTYILSVIVWRLLKISRRRFSSRRSSLYRIITRTSGRGSTYNYSRKNKNKAKAVEELKQGPAFEADISEKVVMKEQYKELYEAIGKLNENYREILILQYFGNMQLKEVAEVLGISHGNARALAHRARSKLKQLVEENQP